MNITATQNLNLNRHNVTLGAAQEKRSSDTVVEKIVDKTYLSANYAGSGLAGAVTGFGGYVAGGVPETLHTTANTVKNIVKTEKYGPVLKAVAATGAVAGGAIAGVLAAPVSVIWGAIEGTRPVDHNVPRQFTIGQGASEAYRDVKGGFNEFGSDIRKEMDELGNYKLQPGEKPIEIPLVRAGRTIIMGAVGAVVGGAVGLVTAVTSAASEVAKGVGAALTDDRLNIAEKGFSAVTSVIGGAVHGLSYGVRSGFATLGKTIEASWEKESVVAAGKALVGEAGSSFAASIAPRQTLLEERPAQPQA